MVLHVDNSVCYTPGDNYCSQFPLPTACEALVTSITRDPIATVLVWMVAAFPGSSSPAVTAFQVGVQGDVPLDYYMAWSPCGPGVLEIPDETWPAPGTGTACAFASPVNSHLFKMYWFAVSAPDAGSTLRTGPYPSHDQHAEWADDSYPPQIDFCSKFGLVEWGGPGWNECPEEVLVGACCFSDGRCEILDQAACSAQGGTYQGDNTVCQPDPCSQHTGACCLECEHCEVLTRGACSAQGGTYQGDGTTCYPNPCTSSGATPVKVSEEKE
jgi:hypothetical protein